MDNNMRTVRVLIYAVLIGLIGSKCAHAQATVGLALGKMLNNTNGTFPGYVAQLEVSAPLLDRIGIVGRAAKVSPSHLSEYGNETFSNVALTFDAHPWLFSIGDAVYMNYDTSVLWQGKVYRYGGDNIHSRSCHMCGLVTGVEYRLPNSHVSVALHYYAVQKISPTFQGGIFLVKYTVGKQ